MLKELTKPVADSAPETQEDPDVGYSHHVLVEQQLPAPREAFQRAWVPDGESGVVSIST